MSKQYHKPLKYGSYCSSSIVEYDANQMIAIGEFHKSNMAVKCSSFLIKISFFLIFSNIDSRNSSESDLTPKINVILVGATGDLAKRYLWKGFFDIFLTSGKGTLTNTKLYFYGASRLDPDKGSVSLNEILRTSIKCMSDECNEKKMQFINQSEYRRLKHSTDYGHLSSVIESSSIKEREVGRIFYLSVPPFAYEEISKNIAEKLRPKSKETWTRVVLEKPFGHDLNSAIDLANKLSKYWKEEEIYRIDHYLGKAGIQQIIQFKRENAEFFETFWNHDYIEQVSIVVKEKVDVKGRMAFYDKYGVIRDVFQNHLTEILALFAMELSHSDKPVESSEKSKVLNAIKPITIHDAVFGQYKDYNNQLKEELPNIENGSKTATFAAVVMKIMNKRWLNVPFIVMSGKSLDSRQAFVRIQFKHRKFCVKSNLGKDSTDCLPEQVAFFIQGDIIEVPLTIVTKTITNIKFPTNWVNFTLNSQISDLINGENVIMKPEATEHNAYTTLIHEVFLGNKEMFVSLKDLLMSWKVWTPLLNDLSLTQPRIYSQESLQDLDFDIINGQIRYQKQNHDCKLSAKLKYIHQNKSSSFRGKRLVSGDQTSVVNKLVEEILLAAQEKVKTGKKFHLALSGGRTAQHIFPVLAIMMKHLSLENIHIWQVDERCVGSSDERSNFHQLYQNLLKFLPIPYGNIHPMPVDVAGLLCKPNDLGDKRYERLMKHHLGNDMLDFVVLGVGEDGHTASLFARSTELTSSAWIKLSSHHVIYGSRMTMTLKFLNKKVKNIAVLILGLSKQEIVQKLWDDPITTDDLPITLLQPISGTLTWYIDDRAVMKKMT